MAAKTRQLLDADYYIAFAGKRRSVALRQVLRLNCRKILQLDGGTFDAIISRSIRISGFT